MSAPYLVLAIITVISTCPSLFFSAVEIRSTDPKTRLVAQYTTARSLALFALAVVPFFGVFDGWLLAIAVAMLVVQALDGIIAWRARATGAGTPLLNVVGPLISAIASAFGLWWFLTAG
ncbi:hypothetical protein L2X99_17535 [Microbacterium sp. KUDC0406]|uniref:hypothetical protein n=1 Tax=Microbacterium sp. KUDC0406 TaxID=2909588 RepID=UPI001F2CD142|nr:hypothetical protein [Microbacterium sp. KUDC0406]UJP10123.1 hypothetical protein L2X99_17535 [Microbacterium sp. KUDC0406]